MPRIVTLKNSVGSIHCANFIRNHYKMSDADLVEELGCTIGYVKRVRREYRREEAQIARKEAAVISMPADEQPQLALNFAQPRAISTKHLSREKVLLAMGYQKNTEAYFVAWMVLKYGGVREAQAGLQNIANQLNTLLGAVQAFGKVAA
jgi:hypothetical protein